MDTIFACLLLEFGRVQEEAFLCGIILVMVSHLVGGAHQFLHSHLVNQFPFILGIVTSRTPLPPTLSLPHYLQGVLLPGVLHLTMYPHHLPPLLVLLIREAVITTPWPTDGRLDDQ
jgi:hypothetical protein